MRAIDPADLAKPAWWEIPGGGMSPGESSAEACRRELYEEAGFTDVEIGPCIWTQHVEFDFGGLHFDSDERIHVAWGDGGEYDPQGLEFLEAAAFQGARWWPLDELLASDDPVLPERLAGVPPGDRGRRPAGPADRHRADALSGGGAGSGDAVAQAGPRQVGDLPDPPIDIAPML